MTVTAVTPALPTLDEFAALRGERFALQGAPAGDGLWAELVDAQPLAQPPAGGRQPFSLLFAGPPAPVLPQQIYRLVHQRLPALDIFLVPVAADARAVRYEAIFS